MGRPPTFPSTKRPWDNFVGAHQPPTTKKKLFHRRPSVQLCEQSERHMQSKRELVPTLPSASRGVYCERRVLKCTGPSHLILGCVASLERKGKRRLGKIHTFYSRGLTKKTLDFPTTRKTLDFPTTCWNKKLGPSLERLVCSARPPN